MEKYNEKQYISRDELYKDGYTNYKINLYVQEGQLVPLNRKYFENTQYIGAFNEYYSVPAYCEKGVICLLSAATFHELTTSWPIVLDVAIPRKSRVPKSPDWPKMHYYLFSETRYNTGITTIIEGGNQFLIYDREKTVCDILFYRNKLGFEVAIEVLKNYVSRSDRDINKLMRYAEQLRCSKLLRNYLEVML